MANKKTKKKSRKQKRSIKNRYEAKKYIELLNLAYKQITSSWHDIFNKDDYLLLPYIKQGIKKGWNILNNKNIIKEIKCNSLCMTMTILNSTIGKRTNLDQLNPTQKIYLFFISYLISDDKLSIKEVTLKHAIRKIDIRIMREKNNLLKYQLNKDDRNIKKSSKYIEKQEASKKQLIESNGLNKQGIRSLFRLDVCNSVDCEYLQEYKMGKGPKWNQSYKKFCLNITEIFKGIVWLNMYMIFNKTTKILGLSPYIQKIDTNINIRKALYLKDIILIPNNIIYTSDIFYLNNTLDQARKRAIKNKDYWVFSNYDKKNKTIDKRGVFTLENKHYIAALLSIPDNLHWKADKKLKEKSIFDTFTNFIKGEHPQPFLKDISKTITKIGGEERFDLSEQIMDSITSHWIYIHRDRINDFIEEWVSV